MSDFDQRRQQVGVQHNAGNNINFYQHITSLSTVQHSRNRLRMLEKVQAFWINGVLEQSLHGAALIALGLYEQRDAVKNPWRLILHQLDLPANLLPSDTHIIQVYDHVGGELLLLGEPGSGKTTLLLELARDLLERARQDDSYPMPVIFNLSSWASKRYPLTRWLVEELNTKYQVPRKLGQSWIDEDKILLLLDGLDEVSHDYREASIDAVNTFRQEHGLVPIVVCSRKDEYLTQARRLVLHSAVVVQPLTIQQIDDYIVSTEGKLSTLQKELHEDKHLQELATTPLMLSIMSLAYHETPIENFVRSDSFTVRRQQIFAAYIQRMLFHRKTEMNYKPSQIFCWLTWLARQLSEHNQTEFYLERIQFDWLHESTHHQYYPINAVGLLVGIFFGVIYGIIFALGFGQGIKSDPLIGLVSGLLIGIFNCCMYIVYNRAITDLSHKSVSEIPSAGLVGFTFLWQGLLKIVRNRWGYGAILGLLNVPLFVVLITTNELIPDPNAELVYGVINGGLCVGFAHGIVGPLKREIQPAEIFVWSWRSIQQNIIKCFCAGILVGLLWGLFIALTGRIFVDNLILGFIYGQINGLAILLNSGLSTEILNKKHLVTPNQGIKNSIHNGLLAGTINGIILGLTFGLMFGLTAKPLIGLVYGLAFGLTGFVIGWLLKGGMACILHTLLRIRLCLEVSTPWRYVRFLEYATDCIFLRKVGGGYIFIHRLFLEYFVKLESASGEHIATLPDNERRSKR